MAEVPIPSRKTGRHLDLCTACHFVWFDPQEFEDLAKTAPTQSASPDSGATGQDIAGSPGDAREAAALARLEAVKRQQEHEQSTSGVPDHWWEVVLAYGGIPIEYNYARLKHRPWVTWLLAAVLVVVGILTFRHLDIAVTEWGLVPARFARHFGLTLVTSFFLHAGVFHLFGNVYFLWIFGDNTEDVLGKQRYLLLIVLATLAADALHIASDPHSMTPVIGASGGISGILAYYCLRFPRASVGMVLFFRWIRVPAWTMLLIWILLQVLYVYQQKLGVTNVAAFAHLGGAIAGIFFWWLTRRAASKLDAT
jgi:membrane associated rhomboid family serine protease